MRRPVHPPDMDYFSPKRPEAGDRAMALRMGPLEIEIDGLDGLLAEKLLGRYSPYASERATLDDALKVRLGLDDTDYYIDPPETPEPVPVLIAHDGDRVRYSSHRVSGWFDVSGGEGKLLLAAGDFEPPERAIENYIRAATAWQALSRGGGLVHAASAVWNEGGYLFYGESGAGKSTLSECNRRARVVSDDLSLVVPGTDGKLLLVGSPFRGTYEGGPPVQGSFPLRAGFRLIQAERADVRSVARPRAFAELVGNLPFVAEGFVTRPELLTSVQTAFADIPLAHLHFRKDDSYWDAIDSTGL